eukprot:COSAG05_NODE_38_length_27626_cov_78.614306_20_plen_98_part_00
MMGTPVDRDLSLADGCVSPRSGLHNARPQWKRVMFGARPGLWSAWGHRSIAVPNMGKVRLILQHSSTRAPLCNSCSNVFTTTGLLPRVQEPNIPNQD